MKEEISIILHSTCEHLLAELESRAQNIPFGSCYLLGHSLSKGLSKLGLSTNETYGNLILFDKNRKNIVYGNSKFIGKHVGKYHTWCVLSLDDEIIIDPSLRYNKIYLRKNLNIKLNDRLPDILITNEASSWYYKYITDMTMGSESQHFLKMVDIGLVTELTKVVSDAAFGLLNYLDN